jgi:Na+/H+ antiporter NhaD/arsenite permease-like protein
MIPDGKKRLYFIGMIVIAANAGGVWSPIGDVTTTMLWIGERISTFQVITRLILPSLTCLVIPLLIASRLVKGDFQPVTEEGNKNGILLFEKNFIFFSSIGILLMVPLFKSLTGLPPYMAIMMGLGILWMLTGLMHKNKDKRVKYSLSVSYALKNIDIPSVLFFFGILLAVGALEATGLLQTLAGTLNHIIPDKNVLVILIGIASSIVDNVPLVAATMGMFPLSVFPKDHTFWLFFSYCSGIGGSLLIIGSAAGIAAMGLGEVTFGWYLKKMSWLALIGFAAGIGVYLLQEWLPGSCIFFQ